MISTAITKAATRSARMRRAFFAASAVDSAAAYAAASAAARFAARFAALAVVAFVLPGERLAFAEESLDDADRAIPEFTLELLDGGKVDAGALLGKPWIVNFWATWCAPCIEEIPAMNSAWESLEPAGFGMLAINVGEPADAIESFMEEVPIDFPVALGDGVRTLPNWEVKGLPTTLIIDSEGTIVHVALGPREWDDEGLIERLIAMAN